MLVIGQVKSSSLFGSATALAANRINARHPVSSTRKSERTVRAAPVLHHKCLQVACNTRALTLQHGWNAPRKELPRIPDVRHERVTPCSSNFDYGDAPMSNEILKDETLDSVVGGWRARDIDN